MMRMKVVIISGPEHLDQQPPPLEEWQRNVVSGRCRAVLIFNAAAMLYNAHTICVILSVNNQHFPKGAPESGGKGKWSSNNSHSHHFFGRYRPLMAPPGVFLSLFFRWQGVCDSQWVPGAKNGDSVTTKSDMELCSILNVISFVYECFHLLLLKPQRSPSPLSYDSRTAWWQTRAAAVFAWAMTAGKHEFPPLTPKALKKDKEQEIPAKSLNTRWSVD